MHLISNYLTISPLLLIWSTSSCCNGEGNFKCFYRGDDKVAPMPNHHLVKGYRTCGHKALPILDPGIKWTVNDTLASDMFRTQWMQRKCTWTWQKLKCRYQTSHFTDGDIWLLVQLMFSVKLNLFRFFQEWCSLGL